MNFKKIVVDSDIILDHVTTNGSVSMLRRLMNRYFCYTTVFNAIELFAAVRTSKERQAIEDALSAMKVLGVNAKSAKSISQAYSMARDRISGLIAGVCIESKLPIVTQNPKRYGNIPMLHVFTVRSLLKESQQS
ncbi:MAG: hypothetical protein AB1728_15370 [Bacteroidota bacterium]